MPIIGSITGFLKYIIRIKKDDIKLKKLDDKAKEVEEIVESEFKKTKEGAFVVSSDPKTAAKELDIASLAIEINLIKRRIDYLKYEDGGLSNEEAEELNSLEAEISVMISKIEFIKNRD